MRAEPHSGHFAGFSKYSYRFVMLILKQVVSKTRKTTRRASKPAEGGGRRKISDYPDGSASSLPEILLHHLRESGISTDAVQVLILVDVLAIGISPLQSLLQGVKGLFLRPARAWRHAIE